MYRFLTAFFLVAGYVTGSAQVEPTGTYAVVIQWEDGKQMVDGFGVSQAGWAHSLYAHKQREEVMEMLFGEKGLHLNILRGEIFPHYWVDTPDPSFKLGDDIHLPLDHPLFEQESDDLKRRGQYWITKTAREKYAVEKLLFSTWSPPAYMKSNKKVSGGHLRRDYYQAYADYLVAFYRAYTSVGLEPYAISPSNEPGYAAPWNSCVWSADKMGQFITRNLGPTFQKEKVPARIVFGENPFWSASTLLSSVASEDFVNTILEEYPDIENYSTIASGHGYTIPEGAGGGMLAEMLKTSIVPFYIAEEKNIPVWMTEMSTVDPLDVSMQNGLEWANMFHKYLTQANVSAFIWWGGAMPAGNNECLIVLDGDRENYRFTKRYETFGNYTRYIPSGSQRIGVRSADDKLLVSAYKKGKSYTIVVVNPAEESVTLNLSWQGATPKGQVNSFRTDADNRWAEGKEKSLDGVVIPALSVITFTGEVK